MKRALIILTLLCGCARGQILSPFFQAGASGGVAPITLDASCSGNGTALSTSCSSAMTVTAGDAISCYITGVSGGNNVNGYAVDPLDGNYDIVFGIRHPSSTLSWTATAVFQNSVGGSITPVAVFDNQPSTEATINCYAWKSTATSAIMDGGAVEQTQTATSTNPTSGTAAAPTNANEVAVAYMSRNSATAPSSGGGAWLPSGTLTLVGTTNVRQASEYQIQTTATAVNGPFTATGSVAYADSQLAILPSGTTGGYRSFSGMFVPLGAPGSAPTGTTSAALLGAAGSTLSSANLDGVTASPYWTLNSTAPTYDATINPTGTGKIMVQGVTHTFGDAGSSMKVAGATGTGFYSIGDGWFGLATPHYLSLFYRMSSTGATANSCDDWSLGGAVTEPQMIVQATYTSGTSYSWHLEGSANDGSAQSATVSTDIDYWLQLHVAGVNERYHQLFISTKSGTWSLSSTLNMDVLCSNAANTNCSTPAAQATTTGTASSGSTALTVAVGTGIVAGQVVIGAGIPDPSQGGAAWTMVSAVAGTAVTLSQNTTAPLSGTTVNFYTAPAHFDTATSCSVSAGSTAATCVTPGTGTITAGHAIGGAGIVQGTLVSAVALPSVTLSIPAASTMASGSGVSFWTVPSGSTIEWGKNAGGSCGITSDQWWSVLLDDPLGTWRQFEPN